MEKLIAMLDLSVFVRGRGSNMHNTIERTIWGIVPCIVFALSAVACQSKPSVGKKECPLGASALAVRVPSAGHKSTATASTNSESAYISVINTRLKPAEVPAKWRRPNINPEYLMLDEKAEIWWTNTVSEMLKAYPLSLLRDSVDCIYILKYLKVRDIVVAGVATDRKVFLTVLGNRMRARTQADVERALHHEISSALLDHRPSCLSYTKWEAINAPNFKYRGWAGVTSSSVVTSSRSLKELGFFREYSQSDIENDFNIIAENLMLGSEELWQDAELYPRIRQKMTLVIEAYQCFNPAFTMQFFADRRKDVVPVRQPTGDSSP